MRNVVVAGLALVLGLAACKTEPAAPPSTKGAFDEQWAALEKGGAEPAFIESGAHGAGLLGEVRRAAEPLPEDGIVKKEFTGPLPDKEVVAVIRSNLAAMKGCYAAEERAGTVGSGKAIVTLEISAGGTVAGVRVDAPAFSASNLPNCLSARAKAWTFPKFTAKEPKRFSYPLVFVGG
jgi:hypothetical protein